MAFDDEKDWTWVLERTCDECGFDATGWDKTDVARRIRENAAEWLTLLQMDDAVVRTRPRDDKWSPLEYAFHVRDVYELYDFRLGLMLDEDGPSYPNWDQDATAVEKDYNSADPDIVAAELGEWADALASRFAEVKGSQWERTGLRSDGAAFTVESFARYLIHDPVHHVHDVRIDLPS
ncbi:MAG: DinB family protein [Acidimicrobiales bacterium]